MPGDIVGIKRKLLQESICSKSYCQKNDPRLYVALSGNYIKGFGYDGNNDGKIELKSSTLHLTQADFTNGLYELSEYDSDELKPLDATDYWMGSNDAYTTYWLGSGNQVPTAA